jgi:transaldolase
MFSMGKRLALWAPNIAVKVPMTAAGIEAIEELSALGITTVGTVSFSVSQVLEVGRRQQRGIGRAKKSGIKPGAVFSAIMCGRVDDYLRDVAKDCKANIAESDIIQAGTACIKRAYGLCKELGYESKPIPAGLRGAYHVTSLAGADIVMSLAVNIQDMLSKETEFSEHINESVAKSVIDNLLKIPEFVRAYEPDGMKSEEFIRYGAVQRTLSQFVEAGWGPIEEFEI